MRSWPGNDSRLYILMKKVYNNPIKFQSEGRVLMKSISMDYLLANPKSVVDTVLRDNEILTVKSAGGNIVILQEDEWKITNDALKYVMENS